MSRMPALEETGSARIGRRDLRCGSCGYGIVAAELPLDGCPMCHGTEWLDPARRAPSGETQRRGSRRPLRPSGVRR